MIFISFSITTVVMLTKTCKQTAEIRKQTAVIPVRLLIMFVSKLTIWTKN